MRINIAFGVTKNWLVYAFTTIISILENANEEDEYHFYIMLNEFQEVETDITHLISEKYRCTFHPIEMDSKDFEGVVHNWLGVSSYYRLKLPSLLEESKILYLDADIIAYKDINELYSYNIDDYYLGAVEDKLSKYMKKRCNLTAEQNFYNSGVLLMNLDKFREDNLEEIIFDKLRQSKFYSDQDVLNDICREKILSLPLKYNLMPVLGGKVYVTRKTEFKEAFYEPSIIHYTNKSWRDKNVELSDIWYYYNDVLRNLTKK